MPGALFRRLATLPLSDFFPLSSNSSPLKYNSKHQRCQVVYIYSNAERVERQRLWPYLSVWQHSLLPIFSPEIQIRPLKLRDNSKNQRCQVVYVYSNAERVERQRRWPEALFKRLATLPLSDFFPLNYETIENIRDAKWFIYIGMPLYPSISIG